MRVTTSVLFPYQKLELKSFLAFLWNARWCHGILSPPRASPGSSPAPLQSPPQLSSRLLGPPWRFWIPPSIFSGLHLRFTTVYSHSSLTKGIWEINFLSLCLNISSSTQCFWYEIRYQYDLFRKFTLLCLVSLLLSTERSLSVFFRLQIYVLYHWDSPLNYCFDNFINLFLDVSFCDLYYSGFRLSKCSIFLSGLPPSHPHIFSFVLL